jgi:hypothetical protein
MEVGTIYNINFTSIYTQNNGGSLTNKVIEKNGSFLASIGDTYSDTITVTASNISYRVAAGYSQGPVLNSNLGIPDPTGRISAGTAYSSTLNYQGKRYCFYGTTTTTIPTTSSSIRVLTPSSDSTNNSTVDSSGNSTGGTVTPSFTITVPAGATHVIFAYPATLREVASVKYVQLADSEIKSNFIQSTINVEGAQGYTAIAYRVYRYTPVEPFSSDVTYKVFI